MLPGTRDLDRAISTILDQVVTPALVIDLDAVEHNIAAMIAHVGDPRRWRPHLKTVKQRVVIDLLLAHGVTHFKVATPDELGLALASSPSADVLFAHPASRPSFVATRALADASPNARVHWLADSPAHLELLTRWAGDDAERVGVVLDVDLGMGRTGSSPAQWLTWLGLGREPGHPRITGLHGYDGHLRWTQRSEAHAGLDALVELARALDQPAVQIVTSGTHSFDHALAHAELAHGPWLHQVSPGTIVLSDLRSREPAEQLGLRQAAFVAARVISVGPGRVTLDAGSKSITPDGEPPVCVVLDHPELTPLRASEEHLPCRVSPGGGAALELGAVVWLVPDHVCTTVNLHRDALWLRGDRLVGHGPVMSGHRCSLR